MNDKSPKVNPLLKNYAAPKGDDDIPDQGDDLDLPELGDANYKAHARASVKPAYALHVIDPSGTARSFQYFQLDSGSEYRPGLIKLRFLGLKVIEVEIAGRNLWKLYDYLHQHRMPWIHIASNEFQSEDRETIVTAVAIREDPEKHDVE